jgi:hypothetical protein
MCVTGISCGADERHHDVDRKGNIEWVVHKELASGTGDVEAVLDNAGPRLSHRVDARVPRAKSAIRFKPRHIAEICRFRNRPMVEDGHPGMVIAAVRSGRHVREHSAGLRLVRTIWPQNVRSGVALVRPMRAGTALG